MLQNILLTIAYDGSLFAGYQSQKNLRTVQGVLEEALSQLYQRPTRVIAAGRTDAGVHADGQIVNYLAASKIPAQAVPFHLNPLLPEDLVCFQGQAMPLNFHARFMATGKVYRYTLANKAMLHPLERRYKALCNFPLDLGAMQAASQLFLGEHDFSAFSLADPLRTPIRTIDAIDIQQAGEDLVFHIEGPSFLREEVRILVGALVEVGRHKLDPDAIAQALDQGNDFPIAPAFPACGLSLEKVFYDPVRKNW